MEIRVLGDLTIDGASLPPKERSPLAALVLRSGTVVTPSELADAVWRDESPGTWPKQVQAGVSHIRRALGAGAVVTSRAGYRLVVGPDDVDASRFERLVASARTHHGEGDPMRAIDAIDRALALWRGEPYADLADWPPAEAESDRLAELRSGAEEELQLARLDCGEHRAVVADAEHLVRTEPLRERRWVILATALYRGGRQAEALAAIRRARELLDDELGIEPGTELAALETAILRQDASLAAPPAPPRTSEECPYRGLAPFGPDDAADFFGCEDDIAAALARLARSPFLAVSGPSGSGKSSLVNAGLVPALRARGDTVVVLASGAAGVARLRDALSGRAHSDVVVVDQFEELFHSGLPADEIAAVGHLLADAVASGTRVVVAVRSDFLDACAGEPSIGPLFVEGVHLVGPLTADGLRAAIEEPARRSGLRLEPGLTELILRDAAGAPGTLPHVSHALVETWLRREGATLTVAGYEASGGITGAIAKSADELYRSLDPAARQICRATFLRLVEIGADGAPMRRRVDLQPFRADTAHDAVLTGLTRARLVSTEDDWLIVAHESLATAWPRLRGWLEDDAEGTRTMHALAASASAWDADGRREEDLYRAARLQAAREWQDAAAPELTATEQEFLAASAQREQAAIDEVELRAAHDRSQNRRLRVALTAAVALFAVAVIAGALVAVGANETQRQRTEAQIGELTSTSLSLRSDERDVAALLAAEAYRRWPDDPRTRSALMGVMEAAGGLVGTRYAEGVREMAGRMIPGTRQAVVATDSGVVVYDTETAAVVRSLDVPRRDTFVDTRMGPSISTDGRLALIAEHTWTKGHLERDGAELYLADVETGARTLGPVEFDVPLSTVALSPDGSVIATVDMFGELDLVDAASGARRSVTTGAGHEEERDTDRGGALGFTPTGTLVYGTMGDEVLLVDPGSATVTGSIRLPDGSSNVSMAVVTNSLAIATGDLRLTAFDPTAGAVGWSRRLGHDTLEPCPWIAASVQRDTIYCGDLWGRIEERSLATGELTGRHFDPQLNHVGPLDVSSDGRDLTAIGRSAPAFTHWRLDGSGPVTRIVAPGSVAGDQYFPSGSRLFTATAPDDPRPPVQQYAVIDTDTGETVFRPPADWYDMGWAGEVLIGLHGDDELGLISVVDGSSWPLDFPELDYLSASTDGTRLYAGADDGIVTTLDALTGTRIGPTFKVDQFVLSVSTDADASLVLITSSDTSDETTTRLFDGRTGELLRSGAMGDSALLTARGEIIAFTDNRITRFSAATFERSGSLPGSSGGFANMTVSADGRTLAVFARNGTVSLYDLVGGIRLGDPVPVSHPDIWASFVRPDGEELAVNASGGIAVWDLRESSQAEAACRVAGRDLTRDEWNAYLGDLGDYRSTCGFTAAE
ncbi:nSTAND1 domain-containing NTPase [Agromyces sp. NPDC055520]